MKTMIHNLSKRTKSALAVLLAFVMVFGIVAVIAPVEAQALSINASDSGFYNVAYDTDGKTTFGDGTRIRVINQTREGKSKSDAVYEYDVDSLNWSAESNYIVWDNSEETNTFYGIYPYNAEYKTFTIPDDQSGGVQDADWMTATYTGAETSSVDLKFSHLLTKVTINVTTWNTEYESKAQPITNAKIHSLATGIKKNDDGAATADQAQLTGITPLEDGSSYTAIICPGKYTSGQAIMTFTVNDEVDEHIVRADDNTTLVTDGLQPGYHYTFNLTVGKNAVEISTISVTDWIPQDIVGGIAEESYVLADREGSIAKLTIKAGATAEDVKNAISDELAAGTTTLMIEGTPTDAQQEVIAEALTGKTDIDLVLGGVTDPVAAITALSDVDLAYQNGDRYNAYAVAADGTYIITGKYGLKQWRKKASASPYNTNLTLACDINYGGENWDTISYDSSNSPNELKYDGVIDGNGYAIKNMKCKNAVIDRAPSYTATFIYRLGENGVIKNLGLSGGTFTIDESSIRDGVSGFAFYNYGVIMGCYNANSCNMTDVFGKAAGIACYNYGVIVGCYNSAAIYNQSSHDNYSSTGGICCHVHQQGKLIGCYNTGSVETPSSYKGSIAAGCSGSVDSCYYSSSPAGISSGSGDTTKWTSTDWTEPMNAMNAAIEEYNQTATVKCNYRYAINTDAATKNTQPLIIVKVN